MTLQQELFYYIRNDFTGHTVFELLEDLEIKNYTLLMDIIDNFDDYEKMLTTLVDESTTKESLLADFNRLDKQKKENRIESLKEEKNRSEERLEAHKEELQRFRDKRQQAIKNHKSLPTSHIDFSGHNLHGPRYKNK